MYKNSERTMAWIARIEEIRPILDADTICAYRVGGWWVVDKKETYKVNDLCVYISIDSWVPNTLAPFLSKGRAPREYKGILGERIRTIKLKGQISQGLLLSRYVVLDKIGEIFEGQDVSDLLGIQKWEAPIPAQLSGDALGPFPNFIRKTDQERVQNLSEKLSLWSNLTWEITEKLDGSSMTAYIKNGEFGVCSRNLNLIETENNSFWIAARKYNLENILKGVGRCIALQGELVGEGIQGNPYRIKGQKFILFDIFDIAIQEYVPAYRRRAFAEIHDIPHVPVIEESYCMVNKGMDDILMLAESKSLLYNVEREGIVLKCNEDTNLHFKAISNKFLLGSQND